MLDSNHKGEAMLDVSRKSRVWEPPQRLEKREMVAISDAVLAEPEIEFSESEDVFRIRANGLDWDIGNVVYAPKDERRIAVGPDGKKLGDFDDAWRRERLALDRAAGRHVLRQARFQGLFHDLSGPIAISAMRAETGRRILSTPTAPCVRRSGSQVRRSRRTNMT